MKLRFFCLMIAMLFLAGCVETSSFVSLENRVAAIEMENNRKIAQQAADSNKTKSKIENDLKAVQATLKNSRVLTNEEYAQLKYDIRSLKEELQRIKGSIEEINHRFDGLTRVDLKDLEAQVGRLDKAVSKNYERVIKLEKHMGFEPSAQIADVDTQTDITGPAEPKPRDTEEGSYAQAKKSFDDGDLDNARIQFENFITKYPESNNADNARFWIADSYYLESRFAEAILEYQKVLDEYQDGNKLAAARLKQGYAFAELGEHANARLILKELLKKFPDSQEAKYATEKLKSLK